MAQRRVRQYQALAPVLIREPAPSTDWYPSYPDRLVRARSVLADSQSLAVPVFVERFDELAWLPSYPLVLQRGRITPSGFFVIGEPAIAPIVVPEGLPWAPTYPDVLRPARRPALSVDVRPFVVDVPLDLAWLPSYPDVLRRAARGPSIGWVAQNIDPIAPFVSMWGPTYPSILRRLLHVPAPSFFAHQGVPIIPAFVWQSVFLDRIDRSARPHDTASVGLSPSGFPPSPPLDWGPAYPNQLSANRLPRLYLPWSGEENLDPIPDPPAVLSMLDYRQQRSWYRSST